MKHCLKISLCITSARKYLDLNVFALSKMSDVASHYIDKCKDSDSINVVAKQRIMGGLI